MHITDYTKTDALTALSLFIFDAGSDIGTRTMFAKDLGNALLQFIDAGRLSKELKLSEMPVTKQVSPDDMIFLGTGDGNKVVPVRDIFDVINGFATVETRRGVFRGKNLGASVTDEQYEAIRDGSFNDMFVGDYWIINDLIWRIIDFDYYLDNLGAPPSTHHLVFTSDDYGCSGVMNSTRNIQNCAYLTCTARNDGYGGAIEKIKAAFGNEHLFNFSTWLTNVVDDRGVPSGFVENASSVELFTEEQVYGTIVYKSRGPGNTVGSQQSVDFQQMALFRQDYGMVHPGIYNYWLRDVITVNQFALVHGNGTATYNYADNSSAFRPYFGIKAA